MIAQEKKLPKIKRFPPRKKNAFEPLIWAGKVDRSRSHWPGARMMSSATESVPRDEYEGCEENQGQNTQNTQNTQNATAGLTDLESRVGKKHKKVWVNGELSMDVLCGRVDYRSLSRLQKTYLRRYLIGKMHKVLQICEDLVDEIGAQVVVAVVPEKKFSIISRRFLPWYRIYLPGGVALKDSPMYEVSTHLIPALGRCRGAAAPFSIVTGQCDGDHWSSGDEDDETEGGECANLVEAESRGPSGGVAHLRSVKILRNGSARGDASDAYKALTRNQRDGWRKYLKRRMDALREICGDLACEMGAHVVLGVIPDRGMSRLAPIMLQPVMRVFLPGDVDLVETELFETVECLDSKIKMSRNELLSEDGRARKRKKTKKGKRAASQRKRWRASVR